MTKLTLFPDKSKLGAVNIIHFNNFFMSLNSFDFSRSPEGDCSICRKEGRPPIGDFVIPGSIMETLGCIDQSKLGHLLLAASHYKTQGNCVLSAPVAEVAPLLISIISAAEDTVDKCLKVSYARQQAALARWGNRENAELEQIEPPRVIIPKGLQLPPIQTGGVEIRPEEYLQTMEVFLLRGYEPEQHLAFYCYFARNRWLDGTIGTFADRMNRAQRWEQLNGPRRFEADQPAHTLFVNLLNVLPPEKRIYLLSDGVKVTIDSTDHVCLLAPAELREAINNNEMAKAAISKYGQAHDLSLDGGWGFSVIPFHIKTRR